MNIEDPYIVAAFYFFDQDLLLHFCTFKLGCLVLILNAPKFRGSEDYS